MYWRTSAFSGDPMECGSRPILRTCSIARPEENTWAGASAGAAAGGLVPYVLLRVRRGGGDEEYGLRLEPANQFVGYFVVDPTHRFVSFESSRT